MKKLNIFVALLVTLVLIFTLSTGVFALEKGEPYTTLEFGYSLLNTELSTSANNSCSSSSAEFYAPLDSYFIKLGGHINNYASLNLFVNNSEGREVYNGSFSGSTDLSGGFTAFDKSGFLKQSMNGSLYFGSEVSGETNVKYMLDSRGMEMAFTLPTSYTKGMPFKVQTFVGVTQSKGTMVTNFRATDGTSFAGSFYASSDLKYDVVKVSDISYTSYTPSDCDTTKYYEKYVSGRHWHKGHHDEPGYWENEYDYREVTVDVYDKAVTEGKSVNTDEVITTKDIISMSNSEDSFSIKQEQEISGGYLGIGFGYDLIKNLYFDASVRKMVAGQVKNTTTIGDYSFTEVDNNPDIVTYDLSISTEFVKDVTLKVGYTINSTKYDFDDTEYSNSSSMYSTSLTYKF